MLRLAVVAGFCCNELKEPLPLSATLMIPMTVFICRHYSDVKGRHCWEVADWISCQDRKQQRK